MADFLCCRIPCGRQLDQYDADIITDASGYQTLMQICRGEGDITLYRLAGGDPSNPSATHVLTDVASMFDVFNETTFELSKINLKGHAGKSLGKRMGAVVWDYPAGHDGPPTKRMDMDIEKIYYDSRSAKRTWLGWCCNADCCFPDIYKITSERVLYSKWELWYLCDNPLLVCLCPCYCLRGLSRDLCPCLNTFCDTCSSAIVVDEKTAEAWQEEENKRASERTSLEKCCACPIGRGAYYFDIDLLIDIGAHQKCSQLCYNEGDLQLHRTAGGDPDNSETLFLVKNVPEVFNLFDDFSYELSQMDLSHFRQSAMGTSMR